ncbi:sigma-54-dependent Fis family transcriptional regulator [Allopusillimonas soli]|uniref:Sigma-54-dependent Fis family transcriptional regulator n=1 Tax=Allopusillimonas soli TaxID=659016 RepID=A0A853FA02_9BURK|nr:sigma-54 dependent transcriptional regulator [Allopusillimonas soli]NYT37525.1 sigma-54-dependent Fis family transcriptional regulator [Allopusillimonas soli]TEA74501.1 sigma-54-dependent Fis family transcriptional regulator [Allopusillimonas soli]
MPHLLVVDDDVATRELIADIAVDDGYTTAQAGDIRQARIQIERQRPDVVFLDMQLPDGNGMAFWKDLNLPDVNVAFITGYSSVDNAIEALRLGAVDYLLKPVSLRRLRGLLQQVKAADAPSSSVAAPDDCFAKMVGKSRAMQLLRVHIAKVAPTQATVLLVGESGTGKELAAEAIHLASPRASQPFLPVNCGAISPNLIESELFGHEKGSFTGADRQHKGYFERAQGGTIFLDEITEMSMDLQVRLLRVLETGRFMRVGTQEEIKTDVRVVAATNRNPEQAVAMGMLREDLYHRLSVFPLELPPLRERENDVLDLADYFLAHLNEAHQTNKRFSDDAREAMKKHAWPGNVRELRNHVYRSYILSDSVLHGNFSSFELGARRNDLGGDVLVPMGASLAEANRQLILATLKQCDGVKKAAAKMLGISLKTLYNRLEEYGEEGAKVDAHRVR